MLSAAPRATLKVVFHCRVLFPLRTHINFTRVNKMYGRSRVHFKVERRLTFKFTRDLPYIASIIRVYARKNARQQKSFLTPLSCSPNFPRAQ